MKHTDNFNLKMPEQTDFYNVEDFNENAEIIDAEMQTRKTEQETDTRNIAGLTNPTFDDSGSVEGISSFPDFLTKFKSKVNIFQWFRDFKAGAQFILHAGQIVNNCVTNNAGLPLSAAQGKVLMDLINQVNSGLQGIYDSGPAPYATDLLAIPFGKMYKYSPDTLNIPASGEFGVAFKFGNNVDGSGTGQWEYIIAYSTENPAKTCINRKINSGQWTGWVSYVTNSDLSLSLSTDILSYALSDSCKTGFSSGAFTGSGYTGALPDINLKYGTWEINKRSANTITVKAFSPYKSTMWVNSYVNTAGWSGWKNCITNSDLAVLGFPIAVQVTDLHSIDKSCIFYYLSGAANAPLSSSGGMGICIYQNYDWITLIVIPYSVTKIYVAEKRTTWSAWDGPK